MSFCTLALHPVEVVLFCGTQNELFVFVVHINAVGGGHDRSPIFEYLRHRYEVDVQCWYMKHVLEQKMKPVFGCESDGSNSNGFHCVVTSSFDCEGFHQGFVGEVESMEGGHVTCAA